MITADPVAFGDVTFSRASPKCVYDRSGKLVQVPVDVLAICYDLGDRSKAPYASIERASTNLWPWSASSANLLQAGVVVTLFATTAPDGTQRAARLQMSLASRNSYTYASVAAGAVGETYGGSAFVRANGLQSGLLYVKLSGQAGRLISGGRIRIEGPGTAVEATGNGQDWYVSGLSETAWTRISIENASPTETSRFMMLATQDAPLDVFCFGFQIERGPVTSPILTDGTAITRAADVVGAGAGVAYSNVPITEPNYDAAATYAKAARVHDPATHNVFESIIDANKGKALTDTSAWTPRGATNRWAMLDAYNNTQTTAADEILLVLSPEVICQGFYVGNVYADEVRVSVVDQVEGLVYSETQSLVESNSEGSFYNWLFRRIRRREFFGTLQMPPYSNALITICIRKIGGTAKCGMCAVGPTDEYGPTLMGLSTEGKDYSSTTFNFDGTSSTVIRPYAKRMTCDVMVPNDQIDYLQGRLFEQRQKVLIWFGGPYGSTVIAGRYASFKVVIQYATYSLMTLTLEGTV